MKPGREALAVCAGRLKFRLQNPHEKPHVQIRCVHVSSCGCTHAHTHTRKYNKNIFKGLEKSGPWQCCLQCQRRRQGQEGLWGFEARLEECSIPFTSEGHLLSAGGRWPLFRGTIGTFVQHDFSTRRGT